MRSTAHAFKDEFDEVPVSSQEILERDVGAIRADLNELKTDFRAAVKRIDERIDSAVSGLQGEIRAMAAKATEDIRQLAQDLREMRTEGKALRDRMDKGYETLDAKMGKGYETLNAKVDNVYVSLNAKMDKGYETLNAKVDKGYETLNAKMDKGFETLNTKFDKNCESIVELGKTVHSLAARVTLLLWFVGVLGTIAMGVVTAGKALHWF
jgi:septation ring formation regulator EzrA